MLPERLTAGSIWQDTLAALTRDFATLFVVVAPFTLLVIVALDLFGPPPPQTMAELTPRNLLLLSILPNIVGAIGRMAVTRLVLTPGETPGRALGIAFASLPAWLTATLLMAVPVGAGLLLLVVPGLYLMARLFLLAPVLVVERCGPIAAVRRSWDLTEACAWQLVLLFVFAVLAAIGLVLVASGLGGAIGTVLMVAGSKGAADFAAALMPALAATLVSMATAAAAAVVYRRVAGPVPSSLG